MKGINVNSVEDSKSANCIGEIWERVINMCQSDPNLVTVNSSQYIFYKLLQNVLFGFISHTNIANLAKKRT